MGTVYTDATFSYQAMVDKLVFMPLAGKKSVFTPEHTEITEKIFLFSASYLYGLCALCG
jgi:hypothetical protein